MVRLNFGMQSDPSPFLAKVEQGAPSFLDNGIKGGMELRAAVAPRARKDIAGQAFGVNPNENGIGPLHVTERDCNMVEPGTCLMEHLDSEITVARWKEGLARNVISGYNVHALTLSLIHI